ncbi:probable aspartyl protease At4g16563 [Quercus lobata]|uniref:probable aspartyl protease At4g16563 n=1 Tax=Quercus lobata TaxID=97700 RepID=UPI001246ABCC|nr:probable aspartyl protease At4g16563 [Quercus lobata]
MAATSLLSLLFLISTLLLASSSLSVAPNPTTFTIPLSPIFTKHQPSDAIKTLNSLASSSLTRAHHLKHPKSKPPLTKTKVFSHSYGGYSISLSFGTPPQTISFLLDTGSSPVWFPCTSQYFCTDCHIDPSKIPLFIPKLSSSSKFIGCQNPNCARISSSNSLSGCQGCNCSQACPYFFEYGIGSTNGLLLSETLGFSEKRFTNFLVGCSIFSTTQPPAGTAGFGRTLESLPSQLGLSKFSYCLISQRFNDTSESSDLVLYRGSSSDAKTPGLSYTPFRKNPSFFPEFYYVDLLKVIVGSKSVNIPYKYLVPENNANGNGGTIVDSGTTFTTMEKPIFGAVATAFEAEMGNFTRASADVEASTGTNLCFNITGLKFEKIKFPELTFEFKGGAKMELPVVNYFVPVDVGNSSLVCLTIMTGSTVDSVGPAIVLGNTQQQNFYVEFDLKNDRFGFRKQTCNKK